MSECAPGTSWVSQVRVLGWDHILMYVNDMDAGLLSRQFTDDAAWRERN